MEGFNKNIPIAYCINLDRCPEKFETVCNNFNDILEIIRFPAIDGKLNGISGSKALADTTKNLFNIVINEENIPYLIIIEDDIYKYKNFDFYWPKILEFINNNNDWDFMSLDFFLSLDKPKMEIFNDFLYKVEKSRTTGFIIYNTNFLKKNIEYLRKCNVFDMTMKHNTSFIQLIPKELIVKQVVDKLSDTACNNTKRYETYYKKTEEYLKNYSFNNNNNTIL